MNANRNISGYVFPALYAVILVLGTFVFSQNTQATENATQTGEIVFQFKIHARKSFQKSFGTLVTTLDDLYIVKGEQTFDISARTPARVICGAFGLFPYGFSPSDKREALPTRKPIRLDLVAIGDIASDTALDGTAKGVIDRIRCQPYE